MWSSLGNYRDCALLFLRLALGIFYTWTHGWSQLAGGPSAWKHTGLAMKHIGISFAPTFWGFLAALAATGAIGFVILGLFFRPACLLIFLTLLVAASITIESVGIPRSSHTIELAILVLSLIFIGPGKYSVDKG